MTSGFQVVVPRRVIKQLARLPHIDQQRVRAAIDLLAIDPRPPKCVPLTGYTDVYRVRVGDYRIPYSVDDGVRIVAVIKVGHRREIYTS